jgi:hypothetical protein
MHLALRFDPKAFLRTHEITPCVGENRPFRLAGAADSVLAFAPIYEERGEIPINGNSCDVLGADDPS